MQTGLTVYSGIKLGQAIYNSVATTTSSFGTMSKADALRYNQYWDDVKNGLTSEQRFNIQKFGDINGVTSNYFNKIVNADKQGRHIVGNKNYIEGRSIFDGTIEDAQKLINEYSGTGKFKNTYKEIVNFNHYIGNNVSPKTGQIIPTKYGNIYYSKTGTHIVPTLPAK